MSEDLVRWLGEQLDEDERAARSCSGEAWWEHPKNWVSAPPLNRVALVVHDGDRAHIIRHDPARVLREIDAKRQLLGEHSPDGRDCKTCAAPEDFDEDYEGNREWSRAAKPFPCPTVRLLALPYSVRLGYREEWRP